MDDFFDNELGRKILALTKASFKVSDLIPDLILREKIKHQILKVYKTFFLLRRISQRETIFNAEKNHSELLREIDILDHYFYLGGHLNLVKEEHLKQLRNGFLVFKSHIILLNSNTNDANKNTRITRIAETEFPLGSSASKLVENLSAKQKKIMEKFSSKDTLKLAEILELFPDVSERTIRNELTSLIGLGKITRDGRGNGSFYKTIDVRHQ